MNKVTEIFKQIELLSEREKLEFIKRFNLYAKTGNKDVIQNPNYFSHQKNNNKNPKVDIAV